MTSSDQVPNINPDTFKWTQKNAVTAILPADSLDRCMGDLRTAGADIGQVSVLQGARGRAILDVDGSEHGFWAHVLRSLQKLGSASNERENYDEALNHGKVVVAVPVVGDDETFAVTKALADAGGERLLRFGKNNTAEEL